MTRVALRSLLLVPVGGAVAVLVVALLAEARRPELRFAQQVAAGAQKLFESGQREAAIAALDEVLARTPDSLIARRELAMELAGSGQWERAAVELRRVLELAPGDARAARRLAEVLEQQGDLAGAIPYARLACKLDPENGIYWIALSSLLQRAGDHDGALRAAQRAVRYAAGVPEAHIELGLARQTTGDIIGARSAFSAALELDPTNRPAREALRNLEDEPAIPPARLRSAPLESARLISNRPASVE